MEIVLHVCNIVIVDKIMCVPSIMNVFWAVRNLVRQRKNYVSRQYIIPYIILLDVTTISSQNRESVFWGHEQVYF